MKPRLLLDTHAVVFWLIEPKRLSRVQARTLEGCITRKEPVALSAISLLEIVNLANSRSRRLKARVEDLLEPIRSNPVFEVIPFTIDVAIEAAALAGAFDDPCDRAIVATARVHGLRLVTSDERILDSKLVPVLA